MPLYALPPVGSSGGAITLAAALDLSGNANSSVLSLWGKSIIGVQIYSANTDSVGSFLFQSSNDETNWVDEVLLDGSAELLVVSGTDVESVTHLQLGTGQFRVRWEGASTSDTALITVTLKG